MPKKKSDAITVVLEGDAACLSALLPGLQLYAGTEIRLTWEGGEALLRGEYVALSGKGRGGSDRRRLRLEFSGRPAGDAEGNVSRPARTTPAYGVLVAAPEEFCGMEGLDGTPPGPRR